MKLIQKIFTKEIIPFAVIIVFVIIFDQWTKLYVSDHFKIGESVYVIEGFLKFTYVLNKGAAFSFGNMFNDTIRMILFKIIPVIIGAVLIRLLYSNKETKLMKYAYALIIGGGTGNVIDRIRLDYVVDFISVYHNGFEIFGFSVKPWYFAIFNIADSAVTIAAGLIIIDYLFHKLRKVENPSTDVGMI